MNTRGLIRSATSGFSTGPMRCSRGFAWTRQWPPRGPSKNCARVTFNADSAEATLAIRDALHPASGHRQEHFRGLKEGGLKLILKNRFAELKKTREAALRRRKQPDWTDRTNPRQGRQDRRQPCELDLDPERGPGMERRAWLRRIQRAGCHQRAPAMGRRTMADTPWTDHHESLARVWFQ